MFRIARVLSQHGLDEYIRPLAPLRPVALLLKPLTRGADRSLPRGQRLREALEELGPVFIKFGQALSTRPDLLPEDIASELTRLQDKVPPFDGNQAVSIIEAAYGHELAESFSTFEIEPLASASVAQVHDATLPDGTEVIVKVLRPNIDEIIQRDLEILYYIAGLAEKYWDQGPRLRPLDVIADYDKTINDELDMRREGANASQLRANFENSSLIYVPRVYWDHTRKNVLVMEKIHGIPIREVDRLKAAGIDMRRLAHEGVEIFFTQAFNDGFFHADMHPGNLFVSEDGQYRAVDFGIMGTLSDDDKQYLATNFLGFFNRDYRAVANAHLKAGWVPAHTRVEEFESAIRTVCEPIFAKPINEISFGGLLIQLFQTARRFEMPIQPQLVLLQKTLLNIEGLGRQLYPQLDLWETAKPFLEKWMDRQVGFEAFRERLKQEAPQWASTLPELPNLAHRYMNDFNELTATTRRQTELLEQLIARRKRQRRKPLRRGGAWLVFIGIVLLAVLAATALLDALGRDALLSIATGSLVVGIFLMFLLRSRH